MKTKPVFYLLFVLLLLAACGKAPQPIATNTSLPPTSVPTSSPAADLERTWTQISFDDIAPPGANLQQCWNGMGMDDQGRIYIGFTSTRADGREDFFVFRYDPGSGKKVFLGSFLDVVEAAGNAQKGESIPKGHTRMVFADGKMYMGSQSFHDLKREITSLSMYRGSHLFSFDTRTDEWSDLSAMLPGGVVTEHEGIVALDIFPERHLLIGLAHPSSNLVFYDYQAGQLAGIVPGIPWKLGNPLSREMIVVPSGRIYTYRGTEEFRDLEEIYTPWVYDIGSKEMADAGFEMTHGFWIGQTRKHDGSKIYINTTGGHLYEFDTHSETFRDLGYELPANDDRKISNTYAVTLSPDETKLYYIVSVIQNAGRKEWDGSGRAGSGELYSYDLITGQIEFIQQLPKGIYTSADLRDNENIYFSHFGNSANLWSGNAGLFILHVPPQP